MKKKSEDMPGWYDFLTGMNESRFFDLMRLYAGEIKTPYNKQKLIESLSAFLHKEENRRVLFALLSKEDLILIAAVIHIPLCTKEKAAAFFGSRFSFAFLHDGFLNLEERLIVYRKKGENLSEYFDINPLLYDDLEKRAPLSLLFSSSENENSAAEKKVKPEKFTVQEYAAPLISTHILASWFAFVAEFPDCCRMDGSFKKKAVAILDERFAGIPHDFLAALHRALINLSLFKQNGSIAEVDKSKRLSFAELPSLSRYAYLCTAFCGSFRRDILQKKASLVIDIFTILKKGGPSFYVSHSYILRLIFLLQEKKRYGGYTEKAEGRIRQLLRQNTAQNSGFDNPYNSDTVLNSEALFDAFVRFGILKPLPGKNSYTLNPVLFSDTETADIPGTQTQGVKNAISIDAGFAVTFLQEIPLPLFFDLTSCMEIELCGSVSRFRITRSACLRAFESGMSLEHFITALEKTSSHPVPQNLHFSLHDWYAFYTSAGLFKGYVLQIAENKRLQTENNPVLAPYIRVRLAPGVYMLNFTSDEEAVEVIKKSGLEFIGGIKTADTENASLPLEPLMHTADTLFDFLYRPNVCPFGETDDLQDVQIKPNEEFQKRHIAAMTAEVKKKNLPKDLEDVLMLRIHRKTVLNPGQLRENSVRIEKSEASGMDFLGKIRIIEKALACSDLVEVVCAKEILCGYPVGLEKQSGDALLIMRTKEDSQPQKISIAQARLIRRKPSSVFDTR